MIVLGFQGEPTSRFIGTVTGSDLSHAAIAVSRTLRFEAMEDGITFTPVKISRVGMREGQLALLEDISSFTDFKVLRHPQLEKLSELELAPLQEQLIRACGVFNVREYPSIVVFKRFRDRVPQEFVRLFDRLTGQAGEKIAPGPFCSQLIVDVYDALGYPLFEDGRSGADVAPCDLMQSSLEPADVEYVAEVDTGPDIAELKTLFSSIPRLLVVQGEVFHSAQSLLKGIIHTQNETWERRRLERDAARQRKTRDMDEAFLHSIAIVQRFDLEAVLETVNADFTILEALRKDPGIASTPSSLEEHLPSMRDQEYFEKRKNAATKPIIKYLEKHLAYPQYLALMSRLKRIAAKSGTGSASEKPEGEAAGS